MPAGADSARAPRAAADSAHAKAPVPAPPPPPVPKDIHWKRVFLAGGAGRDFADSKPLVAGPAQPITIYVVLEGEAEGLPIYGSKAHSLHVNGRPIPDRIVFDPVATGIKDAAITWMELSPTANAKGWSRSQLPEPRNQWSFPLKSFTSDASTNVEVTMGTGRFAVSVELAGAGKQKATLTSDGFTPRPDWNDPRKAPGYMVTRNQGPLSMYGRVFGLARLPFIATATNEQAWAKVALRPSDLVVAAYEDVSDGHFPAQLRRSPLTASDWDWLLEDVVRGAHKRAHPHAPVVSATGRGIAWQRPANMNDTVALGDVVIAGTEVAILETDDGDGWLSNDDRVLHTVSGRLARGILGDLPNTEIEIRRVKDFRALATKMSDAGYGKLSPFTALTGELRHAVASFQTDHHLPSTGLPDAATMSALDGFLSHLGASETKAAADSAR